MEYRYPTLAERQAVSAGCPRCQEAARRFRAEFPTLTRSTAPDHADRFCAAPSAETFGPSTYGHPKGYVQVRA